MFLSLSSPLSLSLMFNFGDDLIIESYRIPWLIWIQLLAMFLLVIILYYLTTSPSDLSIHFSAATATASAATASAATATAASTSSSRLSYVNHPLLTTAGARDYRNSKVGENQIKETGSSIRRVEQEARKEDVQRREGSSTKDEGTATMFEHSHHPCHIFGLAKQAFLKCLGLDFTPENPSSRRHEKES